MAWGDDWDTAAVDAIILALPNDADAAAALVAAAGSRAGGLALIALGELHRGLPGIDCWLPAEQPCATTAELVRLATGARRLARRADEAERWLHRTTTLSADAIVVCSDDVVRSANAAAALLFGTGDAAELIGRPAADLFATGEREAIEAAAADGDEPPAFVTRRLLRVDARPFALPTAASRGSWCAKPALQLLIRPPPERRVARSNGERLGYDRLTGLPNRSQLRDRLAGTLARACRDGRMAALVFVGLDHFRRINAAHGQDGGDRVLAEAALRLRRCTRLSDTVARLAGDQFSLTLAGLDDHSGAALAAQRALDAVAIPLQLGGGEVRCSASVGISVYPADADQLDPLWRNAELALLEAKEKGRNCYRFYSAEIDSRARGDQLRRAEIGHRVARLTPREREVMALLVTGKANKMVAWLLGTATRTIEKHRASIMDKMQAASLAELVRMSLETASHPPASGPLPHTQIVKALGPTG